MKNVLKMFAMVLFLSFAGVCLASGQKAAPVMGVKVDKKNPAPVVSVPLVVSGWRLTLFEKLEKFWKAIKGRFSPATQDRVDEWFYEKYMNEDFDDDRETLRRNMGLKSGQDSEGYQQALQALNKEIKKLVTARDSQEVRATWDQNKKDLLNPELAKAKKEKEIQARVTAEKQAELQAKNQKAELQKKKLEAQLQERQDVKRKLGDIDENEGDYSPSDEKKKERGLKLLSDDNVTPSEFESHGNMDASSAKFQLIDGVKQKTKLTSAEYKAHWEKEKSYREVEAKRKARLAEERIKSIGTEEWAARENIKQTEKTAMREMEQEYDEIQEKYRTALERERLANVARHQTWGEWGVDLTKRVMGR